MLTSGDNLIVLVVNFNYTIYDSQVNLTRHIKMTFFSKVRVVSVNTFDELVPDRFTHTPINQRILT